MRNVLQLGEHDGRLADGVSIVQTPITDDLARSAYVGHSCMNHDVNGGAKQEIAVRARNLQEENFH